VLAKKQTGLSGRQKAALLMIGLGTKASSMLMKQLNESEIEIVTKELSEIGDVSAEKIASVINEFRGLVQAEDVIASGGVQYAKDILEEALGDTKALKIIKKVRRSSDIEGYNLLKKIDSEQLFNLVQKEHPQTIAFILTQISAEQAADIVSSLPEELRSDVMYRLATMDRVSRDLIDEVESVLESRVDSDLSGDRLGGVNTAADILNLVGRTVEKSISDELVMRDPKMAEQIKNLMFVFEDLQLLDDQSMQKVLKAINMKDLAIAMKVASDELKEKIFSNMSERAGATVKEELEFMGPVRLIEVENIQKKIVDLVRKLADSGDIMIALPGSKENVLV